MATLTTPPVRSASGANSRTLSASRFARPGASAYNKPSATRTRPRAVRSSCKGGYSVGVMGTTRSSGTSPASLVSSVADGSTDVPSGPTR